MALYALRELTLQSLGPLEAMIEAGSRAVNFWGESVAWLPGIREADAALELFTRLTKSYGKPRFEIDSVIAGGQRVAVTETALIEEPFCRLLHFRKDMPSPGPRVLLVAPLSGHYATLLRPTVEALLPGHDVYITDWADARLVPLDAGHFDLGCYVDYLKKFLRYLGTGTHIVAVCQPGVPVLCAVAQMAEDNEQLQPRSMTLIAAPIDTRVSPTAVNQFAQQHSLAWFKANLIEHVPTGYPGRGRQVYPGFLQLAGFVSMNVARHAGAHLDFYRHLVDGRQSEAARHRKFYDEYNAVLDVPAEYYLETIQKVFLEHHLCRGCMEVGQRRICPEAITNVSLLTIEGGEDDITGRGQTQAAHALCAGLAAERKEHLVVDGVGHYGTFAGQGFRQSILPAITQFIQRCAG
ncbi:polyhydroxyalkanoate depolymerase [Cupriavidus necator]|uniref:Polyhydroxyalkanoate depolymerase n=1 Tax=Cupriavidus necator TaxID=106590 RepID=A0A1U9V0A0_CUPNE|nr:polyhydroxyalkanoate depolymerase [Cupriavidus necator]AQV98394.1 polyhydroxyalkanoate depolymerase [Cupriavidus necator]